MRNLKKVEIFDGYKYKAGKVWKQINKMIKKKEKKKGKIIKVLFCLKERKLNCWKDVLTFFPFISNHFSF